MTLTLLVMVQAFVGLLLSEVPTESITSGAVFVLIDALARNWPIVAAAGAFIWYGGRYVQKLDSIAASVRSNKEAADKQFKVHGDKLDEHDKSIASIETSTDILLKHTGLTGA